MQHVSDWQDNSHPAQAQTALATRTPEAVEHAKRIAELYESHNRALMRFLTCWLKSTQEAKEVAQEAFVRMLQLDAPGGISYLRAFLFKTAANLAADRLKSANRRGRIDRLDYALEVDVEPSAEHNVAAREALSTLLKAIEELPPKCRYAFVMHRLYGHELREVAELMNLSERMVRIYIERAMVYCRERLLTSGITL